MTRQQTSLLFWTFVVWCAGQAVCKYALHADKAPTWLVFAFGAAFYGCAWVVQTCILGVRTAKRGEGA